MIYEHVFLLIALEEYEDSINWYLKRSQTAAENFVFEIENGIQTICINPLIYKCIYRDYHELTLRKYPFTIVYKIEESFSRIRIVAIYHQNRNPKLKYR